MRILITGGAGFIGSHIAEYYNGKAEVIVLDNLRSGSMKNLEGLNVEFIRGDVRDRVKLARAMKNVDYVFHLAAMIGVPESMEQPLDCIDINVNALKESFLPEKLQDIYLSSLSSFIISSYCSSIDSTSLNWLRARSRL